MIYFQSILSLYEITVEERKEIVVNQLVTFTNTNRQHESFFQFLLDKIENTSSMAPNTAKPILDLSIDFLNSQNSQFSLSNLKQYVQYLIKLFSLKTQPSSYSKYNDFLKTSFRIVNQYNQESIYSSISKIPLEQSIVPLSILFIQNHHFFDRILNILLNSFTNFQKDKKLHIWALAMTNLLQYQDNNKKNDNTNTVDQSILKTLNKVFIDKFLSLAPKFKLLEASLLYMPPKLGDNLLTAHCLNLLCSVSISSSLEEITIAVNFAKTVLIHLKTSPIQNLTTNQLVDHFFTYILPGYRYNDSLNGSLTAFFKEVDSDYLQSKITAEIQSESPSLSTLFLISRFPAQQTIPSLLARSRVDQKSQYQLIFHFLSSNLVPFRFLPRLFAILEPADLHFLNEIFEQKPFLYCAAAIKFLSLCKRVEKIEFVASLFVAAGSLPIVSSPYAQTAFIVAACLRSSSKAPTCPIRLLLDYLCACMEAPQANESSQEDKINKNNKNDMKSADNSVDKNDNDSKSAGDSVDKNDNDSKSAGDSVDKNDNDSKSAGDSVDKNVAVVDVSGSISANCLNADVLDLTNEDIESISRASSKERSSSVAQYNVQEALDKLNDPSFCQSRAIHAVALSDSSRRDSMIDESLRLMKEQSNPVFTVVIGSLTDDPVLLHNCVLTLAQSDLFLLTFFLTTAAPCNPEIILKEIRKYVVNEPEEAPHSFVSRLFSAASTSLHRRQRIARRCIIGMSPFVPFSDDLYETLLSSFPFDSDKITSSSSTVNEITLTKSSNSPPTSLICESIIAVCSRMKTKEDLHLILQKLIERSECFDSQILSQALVSVLNACKSVSDKDALSVIKVWMKILLDDSKKYSDNFESVLLSHKNTSKFYLKEIENSIRMNGEVPSLFSSFSRALPFLKEFDLTKHPSFLTIIISNTLSMNVYVLEFCVNLLRSTFVLNNTIKPVKGVVFSNEYIEAVRPFFTELSSKFESKQLLLLMDALLSYYEEKQPKHQESVFLFSVFAILHQPQLFVQNKFVSKIASACSKMTRKNDYAIMFYLFRAYDAMNSSGREIFFKEFIVVPDNEFVCLYFEKYSCYYDVLQPLLIPKLLEMKSIDSKWKEFFEFERELKLLNSFVRLFVRDTISLETLSQIIFIFLVSISSVNFIRKRGFDIESYLSVCEETLIEFKNLTGFSLINTNSNKLSLKNDNDFYEFFSYFAQSFQFMQLSIVKYLINSIESLISTNHAECGLLCLSSYLVSVSRSSSEEVKAMKNKTVDLFTSFLKNCKFDSNLISFVISRLPSAFSVATLKQMDQNYLTIFLKFNFETATKANDCTPSLQFILNIIRSSTPLFISSYVLQIIEALKTVVSAGKINLSSILVLNIIGELGRRKQEPTCLLKDSSVSFRSLAPLLLSDEEDVRTRVKAIFSLMIFGKAESEPDFELIFASLMSLFVGYENDSSNYISIASDLLKTVEKKKVVGVKCLEMLKFAFQPVLSVSDANCNVAICDLLKYLKKLVSAPVDDELFSFALGMMTLFAKPKRNFPH